jgi:Skp family chaperone for outer membrane proteins
MKKIFFMPLMIVFCLVPFCLNSKTIPYLRVGYIDLESILQIYTPKYLEAEIKSVEEEISLLLVSFDSISLNYSDVEIYEMRKKLQDQNSKLSSLKFSKDVWERYGEITDDIIFGKIQKNIMEAIKKTGVSEGIGLILDKTGNFVYASSEIDLTSKILFRLEENLFDNKSWDWESEGEDP